VTYGLCSRETSFVAVEKRDKPVDGELQLRRVPVGLTRGWGGTDDSMAYASLGEFRALLPATAQKVTLGDSFRLASVDSRLSRTPRVEDEHTATLNRLVVLQRADGFWELSKELGLILGRKPKELEASVPEAIGDPKEARRAWATALAVAWLDSEFSEWNQECALLKRKATRWLQDCPSRPKSGEPWITAATRFLYRR
jgi:hypothetical protein